MARTLLDKLWDLHVVADLGDGWSLLHIDRHLLHDLSGTAGLFALSKKGLAVVNPELAFATADHAVSTAPGRTGTTFEGGAKLWAGLKQLSQLAGIRYFELGELGQGIVHVMAPELGITLPGVSLICGDSHTCTNGGLGALAFGVGSSELTHALATQTLRQRKPKAMRVRFAGRPGNGVAPKDLILHVIAKIGASAGTGYAVEYAGEAIRSMPVEGRMTLCNLSIELGAKIGFVAPDEVTFKYVEGRPFAPKGKVFGQALSHWRTLQGDDDAAYDREETIRADEIAPTITWGTSPEHAIGIDRPIPSPEDAGDAIQRKAWREALDYMALTPGRPIEGTKVDWVFVGSCTNSRLSDLREAAQIARSRQVAPGVAAWVVPGSERVKRDAEAEGLDAIFTSAGFQWRGPGCSMCVAANGERVPPGARCVSTMAEPVYGAARAAEIADVIGTMGPATRMAAVTGLLRTDDANA